MKVIRILILMMLILVLLPVQTHAQFRHKLRSPNIVLEGRLYYGWTLDHHIEMTPYNRHYPSFEFSVMKATYGRTRWEYMYNYPFIGLSYWYSGLGNTQVLGSAHAIFPFISFPLMKENNFNFYFRLGVGLGYLTSPYQRYKNYRNLAIGSHINGAVNLNIEARWRMSEKFMAAFGISLMHFSNGSIKTPNYGLNYPSVNLAVAYRLSKENSYMRRKLLPELYPFEFDGKKSLLLDFNAGFGVKDMQSTLGIGNRYFIGTFYGNLLKPVSYKSRLGIGFDLSYDGSDVKILEIKGIIPKNQVQIVKTEINVAYEIGFSQMSIMLNLGSYLSGLDKSDGYIYESWHCVMLLMRIYLPV